MYVGVFVLRCCGGADEDLDGRVLRACACLRARALAPRHAPRRSLLPVHRAGRDRDIPIGGEPTGIWKSVAPVLLRPASDEAGSHRTFVMCIIRAGEIRCPPLPLPFAFGYLYSCPYMALALYPARDSNRSTSRQHTGAEISDLRSFSRELYICMSFLRDIERT